MYKNKFAQVGIFILVLLFSRTNLFAEEGHHHEEKVEHEHASGKKATITQEKDGYRYMLSISPEAPIAGGETELELEILDIQNIEENFGEGFPITEVDVAVYLKDLATGLESEVLTHPELDAGVYGIHHVFLNAGVFDVIFVWNTQDGLKRKVQFNIKIHEEKKSKIGPAKTGVSTHSETPEHSAHSH